MNNSENAARRMNKRGTEDQFLNLASEVTEKSFSRVMEMKVELE